MSTSQSRSAQPQSYRLLDAIYSTATRNNVPSSVTGEAIMLIRAPSTCRRSRPRTTG